MEPGLIIAAGGVVAGFAIYFDYKRRFPPFRMPANAAELLMEHVDFYRDLSAGDRLVFEERVRDFLSNVRVKGVDTDVNDLDRLLVASGAIILIFSFPGWRYNNISEVLLYKDAFDMDFRTEGPGRRILGLVGEGIMNRRMLLSKPAVHESFARHADGRNTVIHEFAHLVDKADGSIDGIPEYFLMRPQVLPWAKKMHESVRGMIQGRHDDINIYGATNTAEFFAVISEYFFEQPGRLRENHPALYQALEQMYKPSIPVSARTS